MCWSCGTEQAQPALSVANPKAYKDKVNSITLYHGIVIGDRRIAGAVPDHPIRGQWQHHVPPPPPALSWAVLVYIGIDIRFLGQGVFALSPELRSKSGAPSGEAIFSRRRWSCSSSPYLNLNRWHVRYAHITLAWLAFSCRHSLHLALYEPPIASGNRARLALSPSLLLGFALVVYLSFPRLRPSRAADPRPGLLLVLWVIMAALAGDGGHHQRRRRAGAARRAGPDRDADSASPWMQQRLRRPGVTSSIVSDVERRRRLALTGAGGQ